MPFVKGQIANPNGRPKKVPLFATDMKAILEAQEVSLTITSVVNGKPRTQTLEIRVDTNIRKALCVVMVKEALAGNLPAMKEIIDRVDGKALLPLEVTEVSSISAMSEDELRARARDIMARLDGSG